MRHLKGLSLIEVLVVMVILAILAALLMPVLSGAKKSSHASQCMSNLRQLGAAIALYASDSDGKLPFGASARHKSNVLNGRGVYGKEIDSLLREVPLVDDLLERYRVQHNVRRCPLDCYMTALDLKEQFDCGTSFFREEGSSYAYDDWNALNGFALSAYPEPSKNYLMSDVYYFHTGGSIPSKGKVNVLYADLHVSSTDWLTRSEQHYNAP
jgi:prepilin-type N-terminal cleavage/methylation domain-containing protein/prepilin-type processing-associated H-X9-DG protein